MLRAGENGEESRSLREKIGKPLVSPLQFPASRHGFRGFRTDDEGAAYLSVRVAYRAIAVGPVNVVEPSVAEDGYELILVPTGFTPRHHRLNFRADDVPDFRPAFSPSLAKRGWMFAFAKTGAVRIVIKLDHLLSPPQEHGMARRQQSVDGDEESVRPLTHRADGGAGPVKGAGAIGHLAAAEDPLGTTGRDRLGHQKALRREGCVHSAPTALRTLSSQTRFTRDSIDQILPASGWRGGMTCMRPEKRVFY